MSKEKELILEAKHVTKKFPLTKGKELIANDDVSLKFYKGQTLGIVGESGCGKSTFMRMMVQLEQPTSGEILFKGKDITKMKGEELRKNRRNVQMVFQNPSTSFNPKMKVGDIICEPLMNFGLIKKKEKDAVARKYLEMVELPGDFADRYPHNMSGHDIKYSTSDSSHVHGKYRRNPSGRRSCQRSLASIHKSLTTVRL